MFVGFGGRNNIGTFDAPMRTCLLYHIISQPIIMDQKQKIKIKKQKVPTK